jgi:hypothetical protein
MEHLPLKAIGSYTVWELFEILVRAASRGNRLRQTAQSLEGALSGNGIRYHLEKLDEN